MSAFLIAYLIGTYLLFKITEDMGVTIPLIIVSIVSGLFFAGVRSAMPQFRIDKGMSPEIDPGESAAIAAMAILVNLIATIGLSFFL